MTTCPAAAPDAVPAARRRSGRGRAASRGRCAAGGGRRRRPGCRRRCGPLLGGGRGVALPQPRVRGLDLDEVARAGVDELEHADVGELELAGIDDLDAERLVAGGELAERLVPGVAVRGSRTRRRPGPGGGRHGEAADAVGEGRSCPARDGGAVRMRWSRAIRWSLPPRAGTVTGPSGESSTAPRRLPVRAVRKPTAAAAAETARSRFSHSAVPKSRLGDRSSEQPGLELAVGDGLADVGLLEPGGDVPVDAADVVARLVLAGLAELGAVAGHEAEVVAVEQAVEAAADQQVEAAQDLFRVARRGHRGGRRREGHGGLRRCGRRGDRTTAPSGSPGAQPAEAGVSRSAEAAVSRSASGRRRATGGSCRPG